jgi:hypothetical protein
MSAEVLSVLGSDQQRSCEDWISIRRNHFIAVTGAEDSSGGNSSTEIHLRTSQWRFMHCYTSPTSEVSNTEDARITAFIRVSYDFIFGRPLTLTAQYITAI